ncbi:hypothetical protein VTO73DRAFT_4295 [Trametes versicolor]
MAPTASSAPVAAMIESAAEVRRRRTPYMNEARGKPPSIDCAPAPAYGVMARPRPELSGRLPAEDFQRRPFQRLPRHPQPLRFRISAVVQGSGETLARSTGLSVGSFTITRHVHRTPHQLHTDFLPCSSRCMAGIYYPVEPTLSNPPQRSYHISVMPHGPYAKVGVDGNPTRIASYFPHSSRALIDILLGQPSVLNLNSSSGASEPLQVLCLANPIRFAYQCNTTRRAAYNGNSRSTLIFAHVSGGTLAVGHDRSLATFTSSTEPPTLYSVGGPLFPSTPCLSEEMRT